MPCLLPPCGKAEPTARTKPGLFSREPTAAAIHLLFAVHLLFDRATDDRPYPIVPAMPEGTGPYTREGKSGESGVEWREGKSGKLEKWCAGWKVV